MADVGLDDLERAGGRRRDKAVVFLPEPEPRERRFPIISVDDHVVEAPTMFEGRLPRRLAARAPRIVEEDGAQVWHFDGQRIASIGLSAVVGRPREDYDAEPRRFDEMRRGCWDPAARVSDMDLNGVFASLNFPNALPGFAGGRFSACSDADLGLELVRAWNRWIKDEWIDPYPERFIPAQLTWLNDAEIAAEEVRKNAELGFKAVSFLESPEKSGRPSIHTGYWDPFLRACEETGTVICLHVGSSSTIHKASSDAPEDSIPILFPVSALFATVDWLYARIPARFPEIKIVLSEGGIGWVPSLIDRIEHTMAHRPYYDRAWTDDGMTPVDLLRRNFWFCAISDPSGFRSRHTIGIDNILVEADYPHADSTWPDTQEVLAEELSELTSDERALVTHRNASMLFRHPVPNAWPRK